MLLPVALLLWARRLDMLLTLPSAESRTAGAVIATLGFALAVSGMAALWLRGGGLPASAFPPKRLVTSGPYAITAHPIYAGAVGLAFGVALASGSGAGIWIVTPTLAATCVAWVVGFERDFTRVRFGAEPVPWLDARLGRLRRALGIDEAARIVWRPLRAAAQGITNSWREWALGPLRFLSHGLYAALGAFLGVLLAVVLAGVDWLPWLLALTAGAVIGAALWAQVVEGSPELLRPYGYFGSVLGMALVTLVAQWHGANGWLLAAAFSCGAALAQAVGRLRCLVQGCCHGMPVEQDLGIIYTNPNSRVVRLAKLGGVPLHATPVYSALWMLLVAALLVLLWVVQSPLTFVTGMYFILTGLGRFVEEHYRGEPQTATVMGLRLYQWLAIAFLVGGAAISCIGSGGAPPVPAFNPDTLVTLLLVGAAVYVAYGVDVPRSRRRFARLV